MIKEYQTGLVTYAASVGGALIHFEWTSKRSIDLRYVSSVTPYEFGSECCLVTINGYQEATIINEPYDRFVRDWLSVKR